jgi:hypothetical protein
MQNIQDFRQIGIDPRHGRTGQGAGEITILAMGRAPLREIDAPIRTGRDRLQTALAGRCHHDGERGLGIHIALPGILAGETCKAIAFEFDDL